jgi:CAAX protease family protein
MTAKSRQSTAARQLAGFLVVAVSMIVMFTIPKGYFVLGSIISTYLMVTIAYLLTGFKGMFRPRSIYLFLAVVGAIFLYFVFLGGNLAIKTLNIPGLSALGEQSIYGLFQGVSLPLLILVLILDAVGFESYFRGNLLSAFSEKIGIYSVPLVAGMDAATHFATLNPLFPATTFVADLVWGAYFYKTRDLSTTILFHFLWDILIFVIFPIQ